VFVIDSKQYRGHLQLDPTGRLWHGRSPLAPTLRAVSFEADQAAPVPWDKVVIQGVPVMPAGACQHAAPAPGGARAERVAAVANQARIRFRAAA
jgi:hypothetical protein